MKNIILLLFTGIFISSCATYKKKLHYGEGTLEQARMNAIIDFAATYKTPRSYIKERNGKPFNVFWIYKYEKTQDSLRDDLFILSIIPENQGYIDLQTKDIIGKKTDWFPTKYKEINNKLFLWHDSLTPLSREIIEVIHSYGILIQQA